VWRKLVLLIGFLLTLWVLVAVPARHLLGEWAVAYSGTAFLLCLIPAVGTFIWVSWTRQHAPDTVPMIFLAGTGVRLFVVSVAALVFETNVPFFREHEYFWAWLLFFYVATLALEVTFLLSGGGLNNK
jgi:hypothetical protein